MQGDPRIRFRAKADGGRGRSLASLLAAAATLLLLAGDLSAQEFIIHANGDSINGDVKGFKRGKLEFEIPGGSSSTIEFQNIATFGSLDDWDIDQRTTGGYSG